VTLANHNMPHVTLYFKKLQKTKNPYERERRKSLVTLWLANVTGHWHHHVTQVLSQK
jgi:hypothetical protein